MHLEISPKMTKVFFNGTALLTSFVLAAAGFCPVIFILYLNDLKLITAATGPSL